jgi:hypothetical protein
MDTSRLTKLRRVPLPVRDWFDSFEIVDLIIDIEKKFGLPEDETVIPRLLFDVEVRDLPLDKLEAALAEKLSLSPATAKSLYEAIRDRILMPIAPDLVTWGVGIGILAPAPETPPTAAIPVSPPVPVTPPTPSTPRPSLASDLPRSPMSATPATGSSAPMPQPVSLYRDTLASQSAAVTPRLGVREMGDVSGTVAPVPMAQRAARIDLGGGIPSAKKEAEFKSIFIERSTPLPQKVDYAPIAPVVPDLPQAPVPLASAPAPDLDPNAPFISPRVEVISTPTPPAKDDTPAEGIFEKLMNRIAPWHAKKFAKRDNEPVLPAATINYDEAPPAAPPSDTPKPVPMNDTPAPPKPQA